jgi:hypothetical protein
MKLRDKSSISALMPSPRSFARISIAAAASALAWACMDTASSGGSQSQTVAVRVEAADPMCRMQTHLLILDEDAIANGRNCIIAPPTGKDCKKDDGKSKDGSSGGSGGHGGRGGSGGFDDEAVVGGGAGGSGGSGGGTISSKDDDRYCDKGRERDHDRNCRKIHDRDDDRLCHREHEKDHDRNCRRIHEKDGDDREKVTLCHIPPGNTGNPQTLSIGYCSVKAHLDHGDKLGKCASDGDDTSHGSPGAHCEKSYVGNRGNLTAFANLVGQEVTIPAGSLGDEGWFAVSAVRIAWKSAGPEVGDGLRNYVEAGPGLGSPDAKGNKESLLDRVPNLTPLRATGLARLEGRSVCAVVLDGDVKMSYNPLSGDIRGPNLGKLAFQVISVQPQTRGYDKLPSVTVRILDAEAVCNDPLTPFVDAPYPTSASEPRDTERPACAIQQNLITEPWNNFDSTLWRGDDQQVVEGGLFFAKEGAFSAAADWISPCPVPVDTSTSILFSNRLGLNSPAQNEFAESGALFFINAGPDGSFDNYVFVNVGYTMSPSKIFVELFGSDGGVDFDQYEETNIPFSTSQFLNVDLWINSNSYQIALGQDMIDTVTLASRLTSIGLFESGVQQNSGGLRGLIDMTTISKICLAENKAQRCKRHSVHRGQKRQRLGSKCRTRNGYVKLAKERIKYCAHPSRSMQVLSKMKERPDFD